MTVNRDSRFTHDSLLRSLPRAGESSAAAAPAVPKPEAKKKAGGLLVALALGGTLCLALAIVAWVLFSSPTVAAMLPSVPQATFTRPAYFAQSDLQMPTLTPTPTVTPSPTPTETPVFVEMSIVQDTATPERTYSYQSQSSSYAGNKYILVDISEQHMYVYEGDGLIWSWVASTGMNNATRTGVFAVQSRIANAYGATWNIWMPNWLGIYWAGGLENGIHALPILPNGATLWAGYLGRPVSYGCVVLGSYEAGLLYDWAEIGTPVEIRW